MSRSEELYVFEDKSTIKILIVDDREDNLFSIETILEKNGYTIKKANSGRAALRILLKEEDFTLILMDVQMPDLNGFETANMIYERDKLKHIPIIFITANDYGEESIFKGYQLGGVDYIYKPINPDLLRAKVAVCVELYKKNHQLMAQEQKLIATNRRLEKEIRERTNSEEKIKQLNTELLANIRQLELTNEELERFAYVASHDLQEPLRKIMIFSDRLVNKYGALLDSEGMDYISRIMRSSGRMQMLIKNILLYSRASGNSEPFEETDLNDLFTQIIADLEISIEEKQAKIVMPHLPRVPVIVSQFRQLIQNLLINALKFSRPDTPPIIQINCEIVSRVHSENNQGLLKLYIRDNGIGFEQKYSNEIFTLFKRLNSYSEYEGTGIGLSICKKIVEKHNGTISVESNPGSGTEFTITIPLVSIHVTEPPVAGSNNN